MTRCLTWRQCCVIPPPVRTTDRLQKACNSFQTNRDNRFLIDMCGVTRKRQANFLFIYFFTDMSLHLWKGPWKTEQPNVTAPDVISVVCTLAKTCLVSARWDVFKMWRRLVIVGLWKKKGAAVFVCDLVLVFKFASAVCKKKALVLIRLNRLWNIRAFSIMSKISLYRRDIYCIKDSNKLVWATLSYHKHFKI